MREFRLSKPGADDDGEEEGESAELIMKEWEIEEAKTAYVMAAAGSPVVLGFASVVVILALTLAVTLGFGLGLAVLAIGLVLSPIALGWLRSAAGARSRLRQLEGESDDVGDAR